MARQQQAVEFNKFVKGLVTEASPLTFPENSSIDEQNFVLNREGTRERRFGLDYESGYSEYSVLADLSTAPVSTYRWREAMGADEGDIVCVQTGNGLFFFDGTQDTISDNPISYFDLSVSAYDGTSQSVELVSYTRLGRKLVIAFGGNEINTFKYSDGDITRKGYRLKIRDFYGVDDEDTDGTDMMVGNGLLRRPTTQTDNHIYNLRNQTWSQTYVSYEDGINQDPLVGWKGLYEEYPANNDVITRCVYADTSADNATVERFWEENLHDTDYGTGEPPRGAFIIDFLNRSASRLEAVQSVETERSLSYGVTSLPYEVEDASAKAVASYSGRVFYAGFPGGTSENSRSPDTESLVLFSKLIESESEYGQCYQEGDPTSRESSDLLDTDGGVIQLEDAANIMALHTTSQGLIVVASNGVWNIVGGSGYGFSATNYMTTRITDKGCIGAQSIVKVDDTVIYFSEEGIYQISSNQYGDLVANNLTRETIQTLYDSIDYSYKESAQGVFDPYENKVKWVVREKFASSGQTSELVLDINLGAFTKNIYPVYEANSNYYSVLALLPTPPFTISEQTEAVLADGEAVTADGEAVTITRSLKESNYSGLKYLLARKVSDTEAYISVGTLGNGDFRDWYSIDDEGVDAEAYMVTGYINGGENSRKKQAFKITMYQYRTETGFEDNGAGDFDLVNPGSCLVQAQWDWTDNADSGKWSDSIQMYRHRRLWIPESVDSDFDNGYPVMVTTSKLRGRGRVLSLKISTEEYKDLQLIGWVIHVGVNNAPRGN